MSRQERCLLTRARFLGPGRLPHTFEPPRTAAYCMPARTAKDLKRWEEGTALEDRDNAGANQSRLCTAIGDGAARAEDDPAVAAQDADATHKEAELEARKDAVDPNRHQMGSRQAGARHRFPHGARRRKLYKNMPDAATTVTTPNQPDGGPCAMACCAISRRRRAAGWLER